MATSTPALKVQFPGSSIRKMARGPKSAPVLTQPGNRFFKVPWDTLLPKKQPTIGRWLIFDLRNRSARGFGPLPNSASAFGLSVFLAWTCKLAFPDWATVKSVGASGKDLAGRTPAHHNRLPTRDTQVRREFSIFITIKISTARPKRPDDAC